MLLKQCKCGRLIPQAMARCEECQAKRGQRYIEYNHTARDSRAAAFYTSREWRMTRARVLAMYDYIDIYAYCIEHRIKRADTVHHIIELSRDWDKRLELSNLIPLASSTHNTIHTLYDQGEAAREATQATLGWLIAEATARGGGIEEVLGDLEKSRFQSFVEKTPHENF